MRIMEIRPRTRRLALVVLGLVASLAREADAALAPACSGALTQPGVVQAHLTASLGSYFPLDAKRCEEVTKKAVVACHKGVSDAQKCQADLNGNVRKVAKPVCGAQGPETGDCNKSFKSADEQQDVILEDEADDARAICDTSFAEEFFDHCVNGLPQE